jgi:hypothetical protein
VGVELPVVAGFGVAAATVERNVEVSELRLGGPAESVNAWIDRVTIRGGVDDQSSDGGRNGCADETNIVDVVSGLNCAGSVLDPKAIEVGLVRGAERRERDCDLLPAVGGANSDGVFCGAEESGLNLERLAAGRAAIDLE